VGYVDRDAGLAELAVVDLAVGVRVDELGARDRDVLVVTEVEPRGRKCAVAGIDRVEATELVRSAVRRVAVRQRAVPGRVGGRRDLAHLPDARVDAADRPEAVRAGRARDGLAVVEYAVVVV